MNKKCFICEMEFRLPEKALVIGDGREITHIGLTSEGIITIKGVRVKYGWAAYPDDLGAICPKCCFSILIKLLKDHESDTDSLSAGSGYNEIINR